MMIIMESQIPNSYMLFCNITSSHPCFSSIKQAGSFCCLSSWGFLRRQQPVAVKNIDDNPIREKLGDFAWLHSLLSIFVIDRSDANVSKREKLLNPISGSRSPIINVFQIWRSQIQVVGCTISSYFLFYLPFGYLETLSFHSDLPASLRRISI